VADVARNLGVPAVVVEGGLLERVERVVSSRLAER